MGLREACVDAFGCDAVLTSFFNDFIFYRQSDSMLPFLPSDAGAISAEVDALLSRHNFRNSVYFGQANDVTTPGGTDSQEDVDVTDTVDAFESCCTHVERAKH